jgi:hypothetical protein
MRSNPEKYFGQKFGKLTVVSLNGYYIGNDGWKRPKMYCKCDCGGTKTIILKDILAGKTKSCGCLQNNSRSITHGMSMSSEYRIYNNMINRCYNNKVASYKYYGARGITICRRWLESFENFYSDMGARPSKKFSIDRINNDGNYEPSNCRWATMKQQNENKRFSKSEVRIEYKGEVMNIKKWAERYSINYNTLYYRIHSLGHSFENSISTSVGSKIKVSATKSNG